jgi:hypothetical protein
MCAEESAGWFASSASPWQPERRRMKHKKEEQKTMASEEAAEW